VGGTVLLGYFVLFAVLARLLLARSDSPSSSFSLRLLPLWRPLLSVFALSYAAMVVFWPFAQRNPLTGPLQALSHFSQFQEEHLSFFEGAYLSSLSIPWYYAPKWLLLSVPESVLLGFALALLVIGCALKRSRRVSTMRLQKLLIAVSFVFPIAYAVGSQTPFYDGIRHLLFVIPPIVLVAAYGIVESVRLLKTNRSRYAVMFAVGLMICLTSIDMVKLHPNEALYFNRLVAGGIKRASTLYETDYWRNSHKQGLNWISNHYSIEENRKLTVSSAHTGIRHQLPSDGMVFQDDFMIADLYLGNTRYEHHRLVPGEIVHILKTMDTEILYIIRPDTSFKYEEFFTLPTFRYEYLVKAAYGYYQAGIQNAGNGNLQASRAAHLESLEQCKYLMRTVPDKPEVLDLISRNFHALGDSSKARIAHQEAVRLFQATVHHKNQE